MYELSKSDIKMHQAQIKKKQKIKSIRAESINDLDEMKDPERKKLAKRIFHNHEVTEARGNIVSLHAQAASKQAKSTLEKALSVASGFQK